MQTSIFDSPKPGKTNPGHKALIEAHNRAKNGIKLGAPKSKRRSHQDTPIFHRPQQQPALIQSNSLKWVNYRLNRELYHELDCKKPRNPRFCRIWFDTRTLEYFLQEYEQDSGEVVRNIGEWETLGEAKTHYLEVYRTYF